MTKLFVSHLFVAAILMISGCAEKPTVDQSNIDKLAIEIQGLGPGVDPAEAKRAAHIAYSYSLQLAQEYQITDAPIVHNAKVINGYRERGLCNHWAEDINKRLKQEQFRTLKMHWATALPTTFRIIHHSAIVTRRGDTIDNGVVLDPWRYGGVLFWSRTRADKRYNWRPRMEVREELLQKRAALNAS